MSRLAVLVSVLAASFSAVAVDSAAQNQASGSLGPARPPSSVTTPPADGPAPANGVPIAPPTAPVVPSTVPAPEPEVAALIVAAQETTLASQMAGRIRTVRVGLGDKVKKGERLAEFDCSEQRAQLDAAEAEYRGARETHLARLRLQALGAAGELEVTVAAAAADKAKSQVDVRKAHIAYCSVRAPFTGNVARIRVKSAESVNAGQPLVDLVNPASLKAQMFVPAAWIAWLRVGTPVSIEIRETNQTFKAKVSKLNARVDGVSQQLEVEARIDKNGGRLLPGMVGSATFEREARR